MQQVADGSVAGFTSVITLTEVLAQPIQMGDQAIKQAYLDVLIGSENFSILSIDIQVARHAAQLRAIHNLKTPDALQVASAIHGRCDAFVTNDKGLRRVTGIQVLLLDELQPDHSGED